MNGDRPGSRAFVIFREAADGQKHTGGIPVVVSQVVSQNPHGSLGVEVGIGAWKSPCSFVRVW